MLILLKKKITECKQFRFSSREFEFHTSPTYIPTCSRGEDNFHSWNIELISCSKYSPETWRRQSRLEAGTAGRRWARCGQSAGAGHEAVAWQQPFWATCRPSTRGGNHHGRLPAPKPRIRYRHCNTGGGRL